MRIGRAGSAILAILMVTAALVGAASSAGAANGSDHGPPGHDNGPVSYHELHQRDGRSDGVSYDDDDHNRVACEDDRDQFRVHLYYNAPQLDFGQGHIPIVIDWGDGTQGSLPPFPNPHPTDPSRPYELVHTYPSGFNTTGVVIHDNWHDFLGHERRDDEGAPLDRVRDDCDQPPPLLPEVPVALLLPISAVVVAGTWYTLRRRRAHAA